MQIKALQFKKEDNTEVQIYVKIIEGNGINGIEWRIDDIQYREYRKHKWESIYDTFRNNYIYRSLSMKEKEKYKIQKYIEFVGIDRLKEAILKAWDIAKPDIDSVFKGLV